MTNFLNNQNSADMIMIVIFVLLCSSIILILIYSFFHDRKKIVKDNKKIEILEFIDMNENIQEKLNEIVMPDEIETLDFSCNFNTDSETPVVEKEDFFARFNEAIDDKIPTMPIKEEKEIEKIELDIVLAKMKEDLENKETDLIKVFEQEQEEKSVISYQELLKKGRPEAVTEIKPEKKEFKKFKCSEFISPVHGRVSNEVNYPTISLFSNKEIDNPKNDFITEENEHGESFLKQLKEFRKNLE